MRKAALRAKHPIFISHGARDAVVPVSHGRQIAAWSRSSQKDQTQYVEVQMADHDTIRDHESVYDAALEFLNMLKQKAVI
jgi:pimeloyl-ACP methyl ester carboxylesterase